MKVALAGNWPPPWGGVAVHVATLARVARARGVDVRVLDVGEGGARGPGLVPARGVVRASVALGLAAAEGRLVHLHTNGANLPSWLLALAASRARRPGTPAPVLSLHSGSAPAWLAGSAARRRLAAAALRGFGRVVAVSPEIAAAVERCGLAPERILVLPAFSRAVLEPGSPPPALAAFRASHAPLLAALLAPGPIYGADILLPAFAALRAKAPRAGLVAFGAGTDAPALRGPGVLGLGELPHPAALGVLAHADVFVRPTRADGDAVTVREALALGVRVVASDVGHRPAACLLFPSGDAAALAARLEDALGPGAAVPAAGEDAGDPLEALLALWMALAPGAPRPRRTQGPAGT